MNYETVHERRYAEDKIPASEARRAQNHLQSEIAMKKVLIHTLAITFSLSLISFGTTFAQSSSGLEGDWNFSVNQAPWEYSRGVVTFAEGEESWSGTILFHVNREVTVDEILVNGDEIRFSLIVDGYDVRTVFTLQDGELSGMVYTIDGNMPFRASRAEE